MAGGCARAATPASGDRASAAERLELRRLDGEDRSWTERGRRDSARLVVRDTATWRQLWERLEGGRHARRPVPVIDFSREVLLVAAWGLKGTGGHLIRIDSAVLRNGVVEAYVHRYTSCRQYEAQTSPIDIVRLARPRARITFVEDEDHGPCG